MKNLFNVDKGFKTVDPYRVSINIGCLMDVPTGDYIKGVKGENILNGGLGLLTGIVGRGNTFKSTIQHYMTLSAANVVAESGYSPYINTYDTEFNISLGRLSSFTKKFSKLKDVDLIDEGLWEVVDKNGNPGNEWWELTKSFLRETKTKNKDKFSVETPIADKQGKPVKIIVPTFGHVDSLAEFDTEEQNKTYDKAELGDSGGNTLHMRAGLVKTRLLMEMPGVCNGAGHYAIVTSHVGDAHNIQAGPMNVPPPRKLQHMRSNEKIIGVTTKFFFLTSQLYQTVASRVLINQTTKGPEYPRSRDNNEAGSTDLNVVEVKCLRSKTGSSGWSIPIILSQKEGVLPTLTSFHYCKENGRFGISGNNINFHMDLLPNVNLTRTTVRFLTETEPNPQLVKAIKFTSDILQIKQFKLEFPLEIPTMEELYTKLGKTYDWEILLNTRDYMTFNQYTHELPFLSACDLIYMYHDQYKPYWYDEAVANKAKVKEK